MTEACHESSRNSVLILGVNCAEIQSAEPRCQEYPRDFLLVLTMCKIDIYNQLS